MKRIVYLILMMLVLSSVAGCSKKEQPDTDLTPDEIVSAITESQTGLPALRQITPADEDFDSWLTDCYFIQTEQVADGMICYADGVEASEIAVFVLKDEKDCKEVQEALTGYKEKRSSAFEGYAPLQAAMVKNGIVAGNGRYAALLICQEPETAREAFLGCFGESTREAVRQEGGAVVSSRVSGEENRLKAQKANDAYDREAVLKAWESGDDSNLSETNRRILDAARDVIEQKISDDMSEYEKELAVHDYITGWSSFDYSIFGRSSEDGVKAGSDTPYGVLIDRSAMCHGYSSTFQLFMDMLDIECITVFGTPGGNGIEHSWNMVKLDGEWYCVDTAWDDPIGGSPGHAYFNVTSETLKNGSIHHWDESAVPEAAGTKYAYGRH